MDDTFTLVNLIKDLHTSPRPDGKPISLPELHEAFGAVTIHIDIPFNDSPDVWSQYVAVLTKAVDRCDPLLETEKNGDCAALFKSIGEVLLLAGNPVD